MRPATEIALLLALALFAWVYLVVPTARLLFSFPILTT